MIVRNLFLRQLLLFSICTISTFFALYIPINGQLTTELYDICSAEQGTKAGCGRRANCYVIDGHPTCHCVIDTATGIPLAGNPYIGCTWDISGVWKLYRFEGHKNDTPIEFKNAASNDPFIIRLDKTDAVLQTCYITGAIFVITAMTSFAVGICTRAFLDVNNDKSVIFENSEGFLSEDFLSILLRTSIREVSLMKVGTVPHKVQIRYRNDLRGTWTKPDGSLVFITDFQKGVNHKPLLNGNFGKNRMYYSYDDTNYNAPLLRSSTTLFLDKTSEREQHAFDTKSRFIQVGWFGYLSFGSSAIDIFSPVDGKLIFSFQKIHNSDIPRNLPSLPPINEIFSPTTKEIIAMPSVTELEITAKTEEKKEKEIPPTHSPASRFFGTK